MNIRYIEPLSAGWKRMVKALFKPFDISKWFIVGFTAFLAGLLDGPRNYGFNSSDYNNRHTDLDDFFNFPGYAWEWLNEHIIWFTLILIGIVFLFVVGIVLTWVSSRGKFMFLDNVVHDKAEVKNPWYEYKMEGNSLFIWRLVYGFIVLAVVIFSIVVAYIEIREDYYEYYTMSEVVFSIIGYGFYFLILFIITGYISLFLDSFVIPLMYKNRITTIKAWGQFLKLFRNHALHFIIFGLFAFVLIIAIVVAVIIFGFGTCCIGFLLLIIPYINAVVLLPVSYTLRAFSVEYLEQFGDEYKIFPEQNNSEMVPKTSE